LNDTTRGRSARESTPETEDNGDRERERERESERERERERDVDNGERWEGENDSRPLKPAAYRAIRTPHGSENLLS
jgi:hypothetical protein